jgi:hypothetical protein
MDIFKGAVWTAFVKDDVEEWKDAFSYEPIDLDLLHPGSGLAMVHLAAAYGNLKMLAVLSEHGANLRIRDKEVRSFRMIHTLSVA